MWRLRRCKVWWRYTIARWKKRLIRTIQFCMKLSLLISTSRGKTMCSGYGVYPNGLKCPGCPDCDKVRDRRRNVTPKSAIDTQVSHD